METDAPNEGVDEHLYEYIRLRVCRQPKSHYDERETTEDGRRKVDCDGGKERVEKAGYFAQRFHIAQFNGINADSIHNKVVKERRLDAEEHAGSKDCACQQPKIATPI